MERRGSLGTALVMTVTYTLFLALLIGGQAALWRLGDDSIFDTGFGQLLVILVPSALFALAAGFVVSRRVSSSLLPGLLGLVLAVAAYFLWVVTLNQS
jgi:hypothetical protein